METDVIAGEDAEMYNMMTNIVYPENTIGDKRTYLSTGPFDIPAGNSIQAMFMIVGGEDLADLQANVKGKFMIGTLVSSIPDEHSILQLQDTIAIEFADQFDPNTVKANINVESIGFGSLAFNLFTGSNNKTIFIVPEPAYPTSDTVQVILSIGIKNPDGLFFDYDSDGSTGSLRFEYYNHKIADYTIDNKINFDDFVIFRDTLWERDQINVAPYELHPFAGEIPNVLIEPDGIFAYDELIMFTYMWNWQHINGYSSNTPLSRKLISGESNLTFIPEYHYENPWDSETTISLDLSVVLESGYDISAIECIFTFDPEELELEGIEYCNSVNNEYQWVNIHYEDKESGQLVINMADFSKNSFINPGENLLLKLKFTLLTDEKVQMDYYCDIRYAPDNPLIKSIVSGNKELLPDTPVPEAYMIYQNYPNPFNPTTTLRYELPEEAHVKLIIYDILGREVRHLVDSIEEPGFKSIIWDGKNDAGQVLGAGVYLYRIRAGNYTKTKKMILLK